MPTFTCTFTARRKGKRIERHFRVDAADQTAAVDVIVEEIGSDYSDMTAPQFKFGRPRHMRVANARSQS